MKIVSCSNALYFIKSLNKISKKDLIGSTSSKFEDGEMLVKIDDLESLHNKNVLVIQSISGNVNDSIMELLFTLDLVSSAIPKSIHLLITYLGYSRQDRMLDSKEAFSLKVLLKLLSIKYISKIFVVNIHAPQTMGFFDIPSMDILAEDIIIENIQKRFNTDNIVLVSPDIGNAKNTINMSNKMNVEYTIGIKYRPKANESVILSLNGCDVKGKTCIIYDDIIDSAGTLCNVADLLKQQGAERIYGFIVHGVLSQKSFNRINNSPINKIFITNTIDFSEKLRYSTKLEMISITDWCIDYIRKYVK